MTNAEIKTQLMTSAELAAFVGSRSLFVEADASVPVGAIRCLESIDEVWIYIHPSEVWTIEQGTK